MKSSSDTKKEDLKKIIRSLLLSTRHGLTVNELCQEYTAVTCQALPYKEMGYFSAVDMIKDMPDVVRPIFLPGGAMLLKGIADSTTAHISQLVRNQKSTKGYNSRITVPSNQIKLTEQIVPDTMRSKIKSLISKFPYGVELMQFSNNYTQTYGRRIDFNSLGFTSLRLILEKCPDIVTVKVIDLQKRLIFVYPIASMRSWLPTKKPFIQSALPHSVKMEIYFVLLKFNVGMWSSQFSFEYEKYYKKPLNIQQFGFNSVIEMMAKLSEIVLIHRPSLNSDWILHPVIQNEKLPNIATNSPQTENQNINEGDLLDIYISYIITPSSFWFQQTKFTSQLDEIMERLNMFYNSKTSSNFYIPERMVVGQVCCALYEEDNQWYRAVVRNVIKDKIQVYYVDYGNETTVNISSVRYMLETFLSLPFQAHPAKLANINPHNDLWSEGAIKYFFQLTQDKDLQARIVKSGKFLVLDLTEGDNGQFNIAHVLSKNGYGQLQQEIKDGIENLKNLYQVYYQKLQQMKEEKTVSKCEDSVISSPERYGRLPIRGNLHDKLVKPVIINQDLIIHIICHDKKFWISSAELSSLFWSVDILRQMARQKDLNLSVGIIGSSDAVDLFASLKKYNVKGQVNSTDSMFIKVYPLEEIPKLFTVFNPRFAGSKAMIDKEIMSSRKENYFDENQPSMDETNLLKLKSLQFKKKRLHLSMMTNSAPSSALNELQSIEREISQILKERKM